VCALFKISKDNGSNKKSKYINSGMGEVQNQPSSVYAPTGNQEPNSTFVYDSVPSQNVYNQNNLNQSYMSNSNYNNGNVNNQYYQNNASVNNYVGQQNENLYSDEILVPKGVQAPKAEVVESIKEESLEELELFENDSLDSIESLDDVDEQSNLDPLNNANNPIPVNPVAPKEEVVEEELPEDIKANLFSAIGMMFGMVVKPGTTIINNSKKYKSISKALVVSLWISILSIIFCMVARIVVGMFHVTYNSVTGQASVSLNFVNMFNLDNYAPYILIAFIMSFGSIFVASMVYYASSFLNSKGVRMGTYFMVSCLALVPVIIGVLVLYPIVNVFSQYAAIFVFVFSLLYTLISFYIGMNEVLVFKDINKRIIYNVVNLSLIFIIIVVVFLLCFRLNILVPFQLHI
jgi:hypothetical protein